MPPAARKSDLSQHGTPLTPGPCSPDVEIGNMPAWRAVPSAMGAGLEQASKDMNQLMTSPQLDPGSTPASLAGIFAALMQDAGQAADNGAPGAPATTGGEFAKVMATNIKETATFTSAAAVPGGQPAAIAAYTLAMKKAAADFAAAAVEAIAGVTDMHNCPLPCPIPPHGPGVVTKGSKSVLINNLPAARKDDPLFEAAGGSDAIAVGCPTVEIGDEGGPPEPDNAAAVAQAVAAAEQAAQAQSSAAALVAAAAAGTPLIEVCPQCARMREASQGERHRVAFRVVDDETNQPVPGVALKIKLPDGTEEIHTTDANGDVLVDDLEHPGLCDVKCELEEAINEKSAGYVRRE